MIRPGVYPASVTPLSNGRIDSAGMAKLLAFFESTGCAGAVLAGTNGEGPSLSAVEKRDLLRDAAQVRGKLDLILGVATPSLDEAIWLCKRAHEFEAKAVLLMPPNYFRTVADRAIADWFLAVLDKSPTPILAYNFPKMTGITLTAEMMARIGEHPNMAGLKDSSGVESNLVDYRKALTRPEQVLFVGNEALLIRALEAGWSGTISGAANVISGWLSQIVGDWFDGKRDSARAKFELVLPVIESIRTHSQPSTHKAILHSWKVLPTPDVRLPLDPVGHDDVEDLVVLMRDRLGVQG